jgi:hypothetical protein
LEHLLPPTGPALRAARRASEVELRIRIDEIVAAWRAYGYRQVTHEVVGAFPEPG